MNYTYDNGITQISDFDLQSSFSSFLPGISGMHGRPLWAFYVNRGQAIASFGIDDKDHAIMEFSPSVIAYEDIAAKGFRTFVKTSRGCFEAFAERGTDAVSLERTMRIRENSMEIEEINLEFGVRIKVNYYMLPDADIGALVRQVSIENLLDKSSDLQILDGMARVLPFGIPNAEFKEMANLLRSFTQVSFQDSGIARFASRATVADSEEVEVIAGSYFYGTHYKNQTIKPICDGNLVFGESSSLRLPRKFMRMNLSELIHQHQYCDNKIPCALTPIEMQLGAGEKEKFTTLIGFADKNVSIVDYLDASSSRADELVRQLTSEIETHTSHPLFDGYLKQCYLDNLLRGGYPVKIGSTFDMPTVIHLYSRKHGDLERDYNFFKTESVHYSQGNGNFRDVCQNRRDSVWFHPEIDDFDILTFLNLIQADGYNPLEVLPTKFRLISDRQADAESYLTQKMEACLGISEAAGMTLVVEEKKKKIVQALKIGVTPGALYQVIATVCPELMVIEAEVMEHLILCCESLQTANHKEGFWIDHWTYVPQLIESYGEIYPDRLHRLYFEKKCFKFYDGPAFVQPRALKYGLKEGRVVQFGATIVDPLKKNRTESTHWLKGENEEIVYTTLFVKLLHLAVIKCATLDPFQMGIEMEAGKPGWNDAFNGLPGQLGSSVSETHDLLMLIDRLLEVLEFAPEFLEIPGQLNALFDSLSTVCKAKTQKAITAFEFWDSTARMREKWRETTRFHMQADAMAIPKDSIMEKLNAMQMLVKAGIERAKTYGKIIPTYFQYDAVAFDLITEADGSPVLTPYQLPAVRIREFAVKALPLFLEAPAKQMNQLPNDLAPKLHRRVLESELYDRKLKMFKISEDLQTLDLSYGRISSFTPGWFERESIFLHMSYKYLLALLASNQTKAFFDALKTGCIPFLSSETYGRSVLENSSFLASSANPNPMIHGRGYIARLSGSTAEMITLWKQIFFGSRLFEIEQDTLIFTFAPKIAGWLFDEQGRIETTLLGCKILYINPLRRDTFGKEGVQIREIRMDGKVVSNCGTLIGNFADRLRNKGSKKIELTFKS